MIRRQLFRRRWLLPVVVLLADALLLFGSVAFGLRIPGISRAADLPRSSSPDYASVHGQVRPLRPGFVAAALGGSSAGVAPAAAAAPTGSEALTALLRPVAAPQVVPVVAVGNNDDFGNAARITAVPWAGRADTSGATRQPHEPAACNPVGGTVWFRYDAPLAARLRASASAGTSTVLAAYDGRTLADLHEIGCSTSPTGNASLLVNAIGGDSYFFQLDRPAGGVVVFHLEPQPSIGIASVATDGAPACSDVTSAVPMVTDCGKTGSTWVSLSADGRWAAFDSDSPLVEPRDHKTCTGTNCTDVYVRDLRRGRTHLVSVSSRGTVGNDSSIIGTGPYAISVDGRYVTFSSLASNLVPGDTNDCTRNWLQHDRVALDGASCSDIFVHDTVTGRTERVSVSSRGGQADGPSYGPSISPDGRYVAFVSFATNLVPRSPAQPCATTAYASDGFNPAAPTDPCPGVYLHDRRTGRTERIDVTPDGLPAANSSPTDQSTINLTPPRLRIAVSRGGRYVAFATAADNLTAHDTNGHSDVFVRDRWRHRTTLVSLDPAGHQFSGGAYAPAITADGRHLVFSGYPAQPVGSLCTYDPFDTGNCPRIYIRDLRRGVTRPVDVAVGGGAPNDYSGWGSSTADGRYVVFFSAATNLTDTDSNSLVDAQCDLGGPLLEPGTGCTPSDVFVRDMTKHPGTPGAVTQVSLTPDGQQPHGESWLAAVTPDGRFIAFESWAEIVPRDTNRYSDIYLYDRGAPLVVRRSSARGRLS